MHGDVLYLLHPESLAADSQADIQRLVRLALVAICYGQLDHAQAVFKRSRVREFVREGIGHDPLDLLFGMSMKLARSSRWRRFWDRLVLRLYRSPLRIG